MKRILSVLLAAFMLTVVAVTAASAAPDIVIPIDTVVYAEPGSVTLLTEVSVPPDYVGYSCLGVAVAENQSSVHPNNDLIISSGGSSAVLADIEGSPDKATPAVGTITLGTSIAVSLLMGGDGVFSGGLEILIGTNCTPPTTVPTTTVPPTTVPPTTVPPTTVPPTTPETPVIEIVKTATPEYFGSDGIGHFTIAVTNPGPLALTNVHVTDVRAIAMDPTSDCPAVIGGLAVNQTVTYSCSVGNLPLKSPFENEATSIGTGPYGTEVTATATAFVYPEVEATTITAAPSTTQAPATTSAPDETLPVTGPASDQLQGFGFAGLALVLAGLVLLGGAAAFGQYRKEN